MITRTGFVVATLASVAFVGGLVGTALSRTTPDSPRERCAEYPPVARWLGLDGEQAAKIEAVDPAFREEVRDLRERLDQARGALAAAFDSPDIADDDLRDRVEDVIAAHNQLERRVTEYIIAVRGHLTPAQQKRLFMLCADEVRHCQRQCRKRCGNGGPRASTP